MAAGLQLVNIDNYIRDGQPRIAAVFGVPITDGWVTYHLVSREEHQRRFNELTAQGYRPYAISVAVANGQTYISAAYTITKSRGWAAFYDLTEAQYQAEFDRQRALGRTGASGNSRLSGRRKATTRPGKPDTVSPRTGSITATKSTGWTTGGKRA